MTIKLCVIRVIYSERGCVALAHFFSSLLYSTPDLCLCVSMAAAFCRAPKNCHIRFNWPGDTQAQSDLFWPISRGNLIGGLWSVFLTVFITGVRVPALGFAQSIWLVPLLVDSLLKILTRGFLGQWRDLEASCLSSQTPPQFSAARAAWKFWPWGQK